MRINLGWIIPGRERMGKVGRGSNTVKQQHTPKQGWGGSEWRNKTHKHQSLVIATSHDEFGFGLMDGLRSSASLVFDRPNKWWHWMCPWIPDPLSKHAQRRFIADQTTEFLQLEKHWGASNPWSISKIQSLDKGLKAIHQASSQLGESWRNCRLTVARF
jgi:hypothetical protein